MLINNIPLLLAILAALVLIGLEIRLSKKEKWWYGMIPIAIIVAIFFIGLGWFLTTLNDYPVHTETKLLKNNTTAEIYIKTDSSNKVVTFSDLYIYDENHTLLDSQSFSTSESTRYGTVIQDLVKDYNLFGTSFDKEWVSNNQAVYLSSGTSVFLNGYMISMLILLLPFIAIYIINRRIINNIRKKSELKKLNIESL